MAEIHETKKLNDYLLEVGKGNADDGKRKLREQINSGPHSFSIDRFGGISITKESGHQPTESQMRGEMWGGVPTITTITVVPSGTDRQSTLKALSDSLGLSNNEAEKFLVGLETQRAESQKRFEESRKNRSPIEFPRIHYEDPQPWKAPKLEKPEHPPFKDYPPQSPGTLHLEKKPITDREPETPKTTAQPSAQPHVVLKSGDTVSGLYNSIPKDQRPPFDQFKQEFMQANPSVTDPNKVHAGKDYALPDKYNYEGLKTAGRLIDSSVAALALNAAKGSAVRQTEGSSSTHVADARQTSNAQQR